MATNAQWTPASTTQTSLTQTGLTPGTSYVLLVRAYKNNADGTRTYSDYASIPFKASDVAPSGLNALTVNNGTDILLNGGSIFAQNTNNPFPTNLGKFNVVTGTTTGTGVVMNNTGIAAFKQGTREFYLNAATGDAYFAGTITSPAIQSTNYSPSTLTDGSAYSTAGTYINLNNGSITSQNFRIDSSGNAFFKGDVSAATINGQSTVSYINSTATTVAQTAANGKNKIYYSTGTTLTTSYAPNGVQYTVTTASGSSSQSSTFPSSIPVGGVTSGVTSGLAGDTWFSYNSAHIVIAQYICNGGTSWTQVQVSGLTIANIDAGAITGGTISASISMTSPYISGGTISGAVIQTPGYLQAGKYGLAMTNTGSDSLFFSYGTTQVASISAFSTSGISIQNLSNGGTNSSLIVGPSPSNDYFSVVSVINGNPSYGGSSGHLRNIWASPLSLNASPTGGSSGDIWVGW